MGRRTELQRIEKEAEFEFRLLGVDLKRPKHLALHVLAVDTHRSAAEFPAIEHHVVSLRLATGRIGFQPVLVTILGTGERMVRGAVAPLFLVELEHREIHYPEDFPIALEQSVLAAEVAVANLDPQRADRVVDDFRFIGTEENQVAVLCAGTFQDRGDRLVVQVLDDWRLQAFTGLGALVNLDVGQALGAVDRDELRIGVDLTARHGAAAGNAQCGNTPALGVGGTGEHLEVDVLHRVSQLGELELDAHVRLVGPVEAHRRVVVHHRERVRQLHVHDGLEHVPHHLLEQRADFLLAQERGFAIDLGELRLPVRAQILVAEALGNLIVAVEARYHEELLE